MIRRVVAVLAAFALSFSLVPAVTAAPIDTAADWAREGIKDAVEKGFVPADIQDNYKNVITRLEFCRMAVKWLEYSIGDKIGALLAENGVIIDPGAFADTADPDILAAFALSVVTGEIAPSAERPGVFNPGGSFTRQQAAVMVTNTCAAIGANTRNPNAADFYDMNLADTWAVGGINFARANGIMKGATDTPPYFFDPHGTFTRQESILLFNNIVPESLPMGSGPIPVRVFPGNGGKASVYGVTRFSFSPNQSGMWCFRTSDCGDNDPYLELYDSGGVLLVHGDDQLEINDALIYAELDAGAEYTIVAKFFIDSVSTGNYSLHADRVAFIPSGGGSVSVSGATGFAFIPNRSGLWNFRTSGDGEGDPYIALYSLFDKKVELYFVNDDGGDGVNAIMTPFVRAGESYFLDSGFWEDDGGCVLSVSPPEVFNSGGGKTRVVGPTGFSFVPNQSGTWVFRISDYGVFSPYIIVFDSNGKNITQSDIDNVGGGDVSTAVTLSAGTEYFFHAGEFFEDYKLPACTYDLTVGILQR